MTISGGGDATPPTVGVTGTATTGTATKLVFSVQPSNAIAGASNSPAVSVYIEDTYGNVVTTATNSISMAIGTNAGGGTLSGTTPVNAVNGVATFSNLSINKSGNGYTLVASGTSLTSATSTTFNITASTATQLAFGVQPSNTVSTASIAPSITVLVEDAYGNIVNATTSITVAIGTNPNSGTLSGTKTVSASAGTATFSGLSIDKSGNGYTLSASATSLPTATSSAFNITVGTASKLVFNAQPTSATAGVSISPAVTVYVEDAGNNLVTTATNSISMAIGTNPGGGTLSGTTPVNAVNGVATFSNLSINKSGTGYTLVASGTSLTGATSNTFNISFGALSKFAFSTIGTQSADAPFSVTITAQDAYGNTVTSFASTVAMTITAGNTVAPATSNAFSSGVLAQNFTVLQSGSSQVLTATSGTASGPSNSFTVSAFASSSTDYFRTNASSADWANIATWQGSHDGTNWYTATAYPTSSATSILVQNSITISTSVTSSKLIISSGIININGSNGNLNNSGTITGATASTLLVNSGGTYTHALDGGTIPTAAWNNTSTCVVSGITATSPAGLGQSFGNFTWSSVLSSDVELNSALTTINGTFTFSSNNASGNLILSTNNALTLNITGNLSVQGNSSTLILTNGTSSPTVNIAGNLSITNGSQLDFADGSGAGMINLKGSYTTSGASSCNETNSANGSYTYYYYYGYVYSGNSGGASNGKINFIGTNQTLSNSATGDLSNVDLTINSGTTVTLQSGFAINNGPTSYFNGFFSYYYADLSTLTVANGGVLICGTNSITGVSKATSGSTTTMNSTFVLSSGGSLQMASQYGITASATGSSGGNIQTATRTFNGGANYIYNGTSAQSTGNGLPTALTDSLTINNSAGVTLSQATAINSPGKILLRNGVFTNANTLTLSTGSTVIRDNGSLSAAPTFNTMVDVIYTDLGANASAVTAGNELPSSSTGLGNLTINKITSNGTITLGKAITVNKNLTLTAGTLDASTSSFGIAVLGNWTNNSGFTQRNSTVSFAGSSVQTIGGSVSTAFSGLTINNAAGVTLIDGTNNVNKTVSGLLTLTSGMLTTSSTNLLALSSTATTNLAVSAYTNTSYINGPMQRTGNTAFIFPVGKSTCYQPIALTAPADGNPYTFTAEYIHSSAQALGNILTGSNLQTVSSCDYWNLNYAGGSTLPTSIGVTLYWNQNNSCDAVTNAEAIAHFNGTKWDVIGVGAYNLTGNATNGSINFMGASSFSPFSLGTTSTTSNPLPIILDYFTATKETGYNKLTWKVECTSSSSSFDVERSYDGSSFTAINTVNISSPTDCSVPFNYNDYNSAGAKVYYRIKMVDVDGNITYSNIELILSDANMLELMSIQPNPVRGDANLKVSASATQNIELSIMSIDGKELQRKIMQVQAGTSLINLSTSMLSNGIYFVKGIFANGQTNTIKFVKQ